jgi:hypothetical protein
MENGQYDNWHSSRDHQQLGQVVCCRIPARQDKSTMNLFAIDSPRELREDKLGLN